jgi:hypothetical protein
MLKKKLTGVYYVYVTLEKSQHQNFGEFSQWKTYNRT